MLTYRPIDPKGNWWRLIWRAEPLERARRKVVLGLGNLLHGDEGLGIQAMLYLKASLGRAARVEWLDGSALGMNLLPVIESCSHLLVIDAVDAGRPPGSVIALEPEWLFKPNGLKLFENQVSFQEVLGLARLLGRAPEQLQLIGIQPARLEPGIELSQPVMTAFPELVERAQATLADWALLA